MCEMMLRNVLNMFSTWVTVLQLLKDLNPLLKSLEGSFNNAYYFRTILEWPKLPSTARVIGSFDFLFIHSFMFLVEGLHTITTA